MIPDHAELEYVTHQSGLSVHPSPPVMIGVRLCEVDTFVEPFGVLIATSWRWFRLRGADGGRDVPVGG
jgi:hypothetical protein